MKTKIALLLTVILFTVVSCEKETPQALIPVDDSPIFMDISSYYAQSMLKTSTDVKGLPANLAILKAEYLTNGESGMVGRTVYFKNIGSKQLGDDFVPDYYLIDGTNDVSYYIDENRPCLDLNVSNSSGAIQNAMATWDGITCSELGIFQIPYSSSIKTGVVAKLWGYEGSFDYYADITFCGWMTEDFFDLLAPEGSEFILGVTFTFVFIDENGQLTDIDNNKKGDVAFREIYFNDNFAWKIGANIDVETIALHEAGHGLSQAHFGTAFRVVATGYLHFSPRAVMNAAYYDIQTNIEKTDLAGHCSIWSNWPIH